jgi:hypothetical protein
VASVWPFYHKGLKAAEMVVLLEGSPISTEEVWSSVRVRAVVVMTFCSAGDCQANNCRSDGNW